MYPGEYGKHLRAIVLTAAYTASRPGELFALRWRRVRPHELEADIKTIYDGQGREVEPKTPAAIRTIVIPEHAIEAIEQMPRRQDDNTFVTVRCRPFLKNTWVYYWHPIRTLFLEKLPDGHFLNRRIEACVRQGLDPRKVGEGKGEFHFYELRHFGLTRFLDLGGWTNVMDVCQQAGHRDPKLIYSTYGHPDEAKARARLKQLGRQTLTDEDLDQLTAGE